MTDAENFSNISSYLYRIMNLFDNNHTRIVNIKHFESPTYFILKSVRKQSINPIFICVIFVYLFAPTRSRAIISSINPIVPELSRSRVLKINTTVSLSDFNIQHGITPRPIIPRMRLIKFL